MKKDNIFNIDINKAIEYGEVSMKMPSNIALIKYWGKKDIQIPLNPSLSCTLNNCYTNTKVIFSRKHNKDISFRLYFNGILANEIFNQKIYNFFCKIYHLTDVLKLYRLEIYTYNSFPHSSGIASSASGICALASCIIKIEKLVILNNNVDFLNRISYISRIGSGSACRSVYNGFVIWGKSTLVKNSSDYYAIRYDDYNIHKTFNDLMDTILIVDSNSKSISSTVGHNLMNNNIFSKIRYKQAKNNLSKLLQILKDGDFKSFIQEVEYEAVTLHSMLALSRPSVILIKPNTLNIINNIIEFRKYSSIKVCYTLDAGANVHLLYKRKDYDIIQTFIKDTLIKFCENGKYINDFINFKNEINI